MSVLLSSEIDAEKTRQMDKGSVDPKMEHAIRTTILVESEPKLQILVMMRFLPQTILRNLHKLDCCANRNPLRSKTL
jgi:hypothetical protein